MEAAAPCETSVLEPGRCLPVLAIKSATELVAWFHHEGAMDTEMASRRESVGCMTSALGSGTEPTAACVRIHDVAVFETGPGPVVLNLDVDVLALRGGVVKLVASAPVGVQASNGSVLFHAPWSVDREARALVVGPDAGVCTAAPAGVTAYWSGVLAKTPEPTKSDAFFVKATRAEQKLEIARVAEVCRAPRRYAFAK